MTAHFFGIFGPKNRGSWIFDAAGYGPTYIQYLILSAGHIIWASGFFFISNMFFILHITTIDLIALYLENICALSVRVRQPVPRVWSQGLGEVLDEKIDPSETTG